MIKLFKQKKVEEELYLGLLLDEEEGRGFVLSVNKLQGQVSIVDEKHFTFTNGWDGIVNDIDDLLFSLEKINSAHLDNVIYFLNSHMIENDKVIKPYLLHIKKISQELSLKPIGYIQAHEALSLFFTDKEEIPLSAILIECNSNDIQLFLYKKGEVIEKK